MKVYLNWFNCSDERKAEKQFKLAFSFLGLKEIDTVIKPRENLVTVEAEVKDMNSESELNEMQ